MVVILFDIDNKKFRQLDPISFELHCHYLIRFFVHCPDFLGKMGSSTDAINKYIIPHNALIIPLRLFECCMLIQKDPALNYSKLPFLKLCFMLITDASRRMKRIAFPINAVTSCQNSTILYFIPC